jgi:hypothetical protein
MVAEDISAECARVRCTGLQAGNPHWQCNDMQ